MPSPALLPLNSGAILLESIRIYAAKAHVFLAILVVPAMFTAAVSLAFYSYFLGFSSTGGSIDPQTFFFTLPRSGWMFAAAGALACTAAISLALAASVHLASGVPTLRAAFAAITAKSMQIFWLQCVIYTLAARFSPWAALLLWLGVAFAIPTALREDLGPAEATDRAWSLSTGNRIRLLALEAGLLALPAAVLAAIAAVFLLPTSPVALAAIPPLTRAALSWLLLVGVLAPVQFTAVVLTRCYLALAAPPAALHARAASSVTS